MTRKRRKRQNPLGISWLWWGLAGAGAYYLFVRPKAQGRPTGAAEAKRIAEKVARRGGFSLTDWLEGQSKKGYRIKTDPAGGRMCYRGSELRPLKECAHLSGLDGCGCCF